MANVAIANFAPQMPKLFDELKLFARQLVADSTS
jgi:hypothetical protein